MGEFPHFPGRRDISALCQAPWRCVLVAEFQGAGLGLPGRAAPLAAYRPGPRSKPPGTAELLCALSYGSGLAPAEQMEHGTSTAFVGVQPGVGAVFTGRWSRMRDAAPAARCWPGSSPTMNRCPARPEPGRPAYSPQHGRLGDEPAPAGPRPACPARPAGRLRLPVRPGGARGGSGNLSGTATGYPGQVRQAAEGLKGAAELLEEIAARASQAHR